MLAIVIFVIEDFFEKEAIESWFYDHQEDDGRGTLSNDCLHNIQQIGGGDSKWQQEALSRKWGRGEENE